MNLEELRTKQRELTERREHLRTQLTTNHEHQAALAFDDACGVAAARKEVAELEKTAAALTFELKTLDAALAEAARRIAEADSLQRDEAQRSAARAALALLDVFEARGAALTEKLAEFVGEYKSLCGDFRKLEGVGFPPTTYALVANNMRRAVASALLDTDLRQEFLRPQERTTFTAVVGAWAANVRSRAAAVINRKAAQKAA